MSYGTPQGSALLRGWKRSNRFESGRGKLLPEAYKKFWNEWKNKLPTAVHYMPEEGRYKRDEVTGQILPIQNVPIPVKIPVEAYNQMWGGEGVIQGFQKRTPYKRRVPHFWMPTLRRTVVKSEVLNQFLAVVVTDRAMNLIHESHGLDHYLLKTPACDLKQLLPIRLKKRILEELQMGCPQLAGNPSRQQEVLSEYKKYLDQYTSEEIDWYGLTFNEAQDKLERKLEEENRAVPHKAIFRQKLLEQLRAAGIPEAQEADEGVTKSWVSRLNPFSKDKKEW